MQCCWVCLLGSRLVRPCFFLACMPSSSAHLQVLLNLTTDQHASMKGTTGCQGSAHLLNPFALLKGGSCRARHVGLGRLCQHLRHRMLRPQNWSQQPRQRSQSVLQAAGDKPSTHPMYPPSAVLTIMLCCRDHICSDTDGSAMRSELTLGAGRRRWCSSLAARAPAASYQGEASTRRAGRSAYISSRKWATASASPTCGGSHGCCPLSCGSRNPA